MAPRPSTRRLRAVWRPAPAGAVDADGVTASLRGALDDARDDLDRATTPTPEFRDALRTRLLAVAAVQDPTATGAEPARHRIPAVTPPGRSFPRLASVTAAAVALVVTGAGTVAAAERSLPGQPLYGTKRALETWQVRAASGPLDRGLTHLGLAETRLAEVRALAERGPRTAGGFSLPARSSPVEPAAAGGSDGLITRTLSDMDHETRAGGSLVERAVRATGDPQPLVQLQQWTDSQSDRLRDVVPALRAPERERAQASLSLVAGLDSGAAALLAPGCLAAGAGPAPASCPASGSVVPDPVVPEPAVPPLVAPGPGTPGPGTGAPEVPDADPTPARPPGPSTPTPPVLVPPDVTPRSPRRSPLARWAPVTWTPVSWTPVSWTRPGPRPGHPDVQPAAAWHAADQPPAGQPAADQPPAGHPAPGQPPTGRAARRATGRAARRAPPVEPPLEPPPVEPPLEPPVAPPVEAPVEPPAWPVPPPMGWPGAPAPVSPPA